MDNDLTYISKNPHFYKWWEYVTSILRSQNVTSNGVSSNRRYMPLRLSDRWIHRISHYLNVKNEEKQKHERIKRIRISG